jgi:hypothetical protein
MLSDAQISQFIRDGFVKIPQAFPRELADQSCTILWRDTGCVAADPTTWTKPVIRLGMYGQAGGNPEGISERSRLVFRRMTIPETPAGTSTAVSRPISAILVTF